MNNSFWLIVSLSSMHQIDFCTKQKWYGGSVEKILFIQYLVYARVNGSHLTLDSIVIEKGILLGDKSGPKKLAFFSQLQ